MTQSIAASPEMSDVREINPRRSAPYSKLDRDDDVGLRKSGRWLRSVSSVISVADSECFSNSAQRRTIQAALELFRNIPSLVRPRTWSGPKATPNGMSLFRDDAGSVGPIIALPMVVLIGLTSLAVEGGLWYVAYREGQNTADAAAMAAAMTIANSGDPTSVNGPSEVKGMTYQGNERSVDVSSLVQAAAGNGFGGQMQVTINRPPRSGSLTTSNSAVEAVVQQPRDAGLSGLFGLSKVEIRNRAVATVDYVNGACILSLRQSLTIWGNIRITAPSCTLASNATGLESIEVGGSALVSALSLHAYGECSGCEDPTKVTVLSPVTSYGIKSENRFEKLDALAWPTFVGSTCDNVVYGTGGKNETLNPTYANTGSEPGTFLPTNGGKAYCGGLHLAGGSVIDLRPGIYIFQEAAIKADGGVLTCSTCNLQNGVHMVQIDRMGAVDKLWIDGSAIVALSAGLKIPSIPTMTSSLSDLAGVLFYRTKDSQNGNDDEIVINGNSMTILTGGLYSPNGDFRFNGNSGSDCTLIVGASVTMTGDSVLNGTGCADIGLKIAKTRVVQLKE